MRALLNRTRHHRHTILLLRPVLSMPFVPHRMRWAPRATMAQQGVESARHSLRSMLDGADDRDISGRGRVPGVHGIVQPPLQGAFVVLLRGRWGAVTAEQLFGTVAKGHSQFYGAEHLGGV